MPWKKEPWKSYIKTAVGDVWRSRLLSNKKKTLSGIIWPGQLEPHGAILACRGNPHKALPARTRIKMLTGRYNTQTSIWNRNKGVKPECQLCDAPQEDIKHLLTECDELLGQEILQMQSDLFDLYRKENISPPQNQNEEVSAILNGGGFIRDSGEVIELKKNIIEAHQSSSNICYRLHVIRKEKLEKSEENSCKAVNCT